MTRQLDGAADEIRARVPAVLAAYERTRDTVLLAGVVDPALKERCFSYLAAGSDRPRWSGRENRDGESSQRSC